MPPPDVRAALAAVTAELPGGGEPRPRQADMAQAVADAIRTKRHLVVQAGTGTGKSLAYLVPAVLAGTRVVVATATKALQDQLAGKDLPFLAAHLGRRFDFAVLKGRSNYVCMQRIKEISGEGQLALDGLAERASPTELAGLKVWATTTTSGDRAELALEPSREAWAAVSVSSLECPGAKRCPKGDVCFAEAARRRAADADVVVVNTHLYGLDLASGGQVLPEHDVVVVDEVHQLEDIVSETCGFEIGAGRFVNLARAVRAIVDDPATVDDVETSGSLIAAVLADHVGRRLRGALDAEIADALVLARDRLDRVMAGLRSVPDNEVGDVKDRKLRAINLATNLQVDLAAALEVPTSSVAWVEGPPHNPRLEVAPIDIAEILRAGLWDKRTAVLTSATVPALLPTRLGLGDHEVTVLDVGSPFDYEAHALLYCAAHLPDPRQPAFDPAMHDELAALIEAAGGRTLALFTSYRSMDAAVEALRPRLSTTILSQRDLPKPALLATFTGEESTSLFATMGFWQGIDVPGRTLSLVTIDRLPFPRPDEPLLQAKRERAKADAFRVIDLPAAMLLAQGVGRLIRNADDRGVVAVFDPRLANARSYRWEVLAALPPMRRTKDRAEAESFLRSLHDDPGSAARGRFDDLSWAGRRGGTRPGGAMIETRRYRHACRAVAVALVLGLTAVGTSAVGASSAGASTPGQTAAWVLLPPNVPPRSIPKVPDFTDQSCSFPGFDDSAKCQTPTMQALTNARSQEGLGPLVLPSNYASLTRAQQLFVLMNIERVDRRLPPITGLVDALSNASYSAALAFADPSPPPGYPFHVAAGEFAGGESTALGTLYDWMYYDGVGGVNRDCVVSTSPGCWGHRLGILATFDNNWSSMGTAATIGTYQGSPITVYAALIVGDVSGRKPAYSFLWSQEVPFLTPPPIVRAVTPASGPAAGGSSITLTGARLAQISAVDFGAAGPATGLRPSSDGTSLVVTTPPSAAIGTVTVTIRFPSGTANVGSFTFDRSGPSPPRSVGATVPAAGRANVTWAAPVSSGGLPLLGYTVTPLLRGSVAQQAQSAGPKATSLPLSGLVDGESYTFRVAVANDIGVSRPATSPMVVPPFATLAPFVQHQHVDFVGTPVSATDLLTELGALQKGARPADYPAALRRSTDALANVDPTTRLYFAYLLRIPDRSGLAFWIGKKRGGTSLAAISNSFAASSEFVNRYGRLTNTDFVKLVYLNVLGRAGDSGGVTYWTGQLTAGKASRGQVMIGFSESSEYTRKQGPAVDVAVTWIDLLGASPDPVSFAAWVTDLTTGLKRVNDLAAFLLADPRYATRVG